MNTIDTFDFVSRTSINYFKNENTIISIDDVGIYEGNNRLKQFDQGTAILTTFRILWIPIEISSSASKALSISLSLIDNFSLYVSTFSSLA